MRIVCDENIPYTIEAFGLLGEVILLPGRQMTADQVREADALIVRSVTKVNAALLEGSRVRFVGTCTIGTDHLDIPYLGQREITWASAPGCNANSVGEYITAALLHLAQRHDLNLQGMKIGIVGVGNVGKNVLGKVQALGMQPVLNDPPLAEATGDKRYHALEEIFDCDIITLHTPLTRGGAHPTFHLVDEGFLSRMKPGSILMNSGRGAVVDNTALLRAMESGHLRGVVLDVWENEPAPDLQLLERVDIATPHIAGYSFDGKVKGTAQVYAALCGHLGTPAKWDWRAAMPLPPTPQLALDTAAPDALSTAVSTIYDIMSDDAAMRRLLAAAPGTTGALFDQLRRQYPQRREFPNTRVVLSRHDPALMRQLKGIGFACEASSA